MASELEINLINRLAMGDAFRRRATDSGDVEAVVEFVDGERRSTTFKELNNLVNKCVWAMRANGLKQGDTIAIFGENSLEFLVALVGCYKGGFIALPVNYMQGANDLAYILEHSGASAIFADAALQQTVAGLVDDRDKSFFLSSLCENSPEGDERFGAFDELLSGQSEQEIEDIIINDDDVAQIMYTSGTTSRPKGVMTSHKALFVGTLNVALSIGARPGELSAIIVLPMFHITAQMFCITNLHVASKIVFLRGFDPNLVLELVETEEIGFLILLPLMWRACLASPNLKKHDYSTVKIGMYGMAPMDTKTLMAVKETFNCDIMLGSGQTETSGCVTILDDKWVGVKDGNYWGDGTIAADQAVMDDKGNILPAGEEGEIVWRGPQTMEGYFKNDEANAEASAFGWHHSGDIGIIDEDNQLLFVDRKKDIIKSGGENVSSVLVEATILLVPGVANAAVFGVPHDHWGEAVVAAILTAEGAEVTEDMVKQVCKDELGGFQAPKKVLLMDAFPMTATGKVKKNELRNANVGLFKEA